MSEIKPVKTRVGRYLSLLAPRAVFYFFLVKFIVENNVTVESFVRMTPNYMYSLLAMLFAFLGAIVCFYIEVHQVTKLCGESTENL